MEQNKTGKYLKYAIGEIVLVVIGILIALSINNWNEGNKRQAQELKILEEIKSELQDALIDLVKDVEDHNRNLNSTKLIGDAILFNQKYHDSLNKHFLLIIDHEDFIAKQSAFESLKSIGLEIITNDSLREKITTTYLHIEKQIGEENRSNKSATKLWSILEPHFVIDEEELISRKEDRWFRGYRDFPFTIADYNKLMNDKRFLLKIQEAIHSREIQIYGYMIFRNGIEEVISNISQELKRLE